MKHLGSPHQIDRQIRPKAWPPKWSVFGKDRSQLPNDIATWTPKPNTDVRPGPGAYNLNRQSKWKATSRSGCTWGRRWLGFALFFIGTIFSKLFLPLGHLEVAFLLPLNLKQTQAATISFWGYQIFILKCGRILLKRVVLEWNMGTGCDIDQKQDDGIGLPSESQGEEKGGEDH